MIMTVEEFIATNPSKEECGAMICSIANNYAVKINEAPAWDRLSEFGKFTIGDFYNDKQETIEKYGQESVEVFGMTNWKVKIQ